MCMDEPADAVPCFRFMRSRRIRPATRFDNNPVTQVEDGRLSGVKIEVPDNMQEEVGAGVGIGERRRVAASRELSVEA